MDAGQNDVGGHGADDMGLVGDVRRAEPGGEPIGPDDAAGRRVRCDEGMQRGPGEIGDRRETQASEHEFVGLAADDFGGADQQELAVVASSLPAGRRIVLAAKRGSSSRLPPPGRTAGSVRGRSSPL